MDPSLEKAYVKLSNNLEELVKIYRSLLDIVRKEKDYLILANQEKLEENNQLKESVLFKLRAQDSLRMRYAAELASLLKSDVDNPRLLVLAQKMGGHEGDRLRSLHSALDIVIRRMTEINKENEEYAKSALKTLDGALQDIKGSLSGKKTYEKSGQYKSGSDTAGHFVRKEI
ncbi:MAG: flagellar protein FlgN [Pseudobdellovibrionaceae bacterium]